ncbi:MAG: 1,4-dihydroxy-6-naphthoate synthase [Flavobacteriales bacterium]|jgi:1,4-dihydroxy-6-naphthoate synthase|nr:1,4-dihydroxy-6-naphthoate synthase [Flavobacteriales bacterium]
MKHKLTLGFSPCPNDTFIFDALVNGRIDNPDFDIEVVLADVEELNRKALGGKLDVTKISYNAFAHVSSEYQLLNAGSALGNNCGPLLISRRRISEDAVSRLTIAIPGEKTTANFLLTYAYPNATSKKEMLFSEIEQAVLNEEVDAGVIIHENRFTYQDKGLRKIRDLGEFWEQKTGFPIPLGGIAIHRRINPDLSQKVDQLLRESVQYAFDNPDASKEYVKCHSQEMEDSVIRNHIDLYVNKYTLDLGENGKAAILKMYEIGARLPGFPKAQMELFV